MVSSTSINGATVGSLLASSYGTTAKMQTLLKSPHAKNNGEIYTDINTATQPLLAALTEISSKCRKTAYRIEPKLLELDTHISTLCTLLLGELDKTTSHTFPIVKDYGNPEVLTSEFDKVWAPAVSQFDQWKEILVQLATKVDTIRLSLLARKAYTEKALQEFDLESESPASGLAKRIMLLSNVNSAKANHDFFLSSWSKVHRTCSQLFWQLHLMPISGRDCRVMQQLAVNIQHKAAEVRKARKELETDPADFTKRSIAREALNGFEVSWSKYLSNWSTLKLATKVLIEGDGQLMSVNERLWGLIELAERAKNGMNVRAYSICEPQVLHCVETSNQTILDRIAKDLDDAQQLIKTNYASVDRAMRSEFGHSETRGLAFELDRLSHLINCQTKQYPNTLGISTRKFRDQLVLKLL